MCGRSLTMLTLFGRWVSPQGRHPPVGGLGQPVVHVVSKEACVLSEWSGSSVIADSTNQAHQRDHSVC